MSILDRYILVRFGLNFLTLFLLLYVFAVSVDLILHLEDYVEAARSAVGDEAGWLRFTMALGAIIFDFQAPRMFQFYAFLHGMVAIGAMGFTLAQMHRHRELVAVMAAGLSLHRVAMPFIVAVFALSVAQMLNQELVLPQLAPLLLRGEDKIGERSIEGFAVRFTPDSKGNLLQAARFDPHTNVLTWPTFIERDQRGRAMRRVWAASAVWAPAQQSWLLTDGRALRLDMGDEADATVPAGGGLMVSEAAGSFPSDLTPQLLLVRRYSQFASMLSLNQISQMLQTPRAEGARGAGNDRDTLLRHRYSRFSSVLVNLLVLLLTLPCFLLREPANLLKKSVLAASIAIPATMGSAIGMMVSLPGIPPAVGVFLPVIVLMFMSLFPWTFFKT